MDNINSGFIKLYRSFKEWEWYSDTNTKVLFIHCLIMANYENKKWKGLEINKGSFVTSIGHLSDDLQLSKQQVRTALKKLEKSGELTIKSTNKNTVITLNNWDLYQTKDPIITDGQQTNNNQTTNKQQSNNNQITTTKELKKLRTKEVKKLRNKEIKNKDIKDLKDIVEETSTTHKADVEAVINHLNLVLNTRYRSTTPNNIKLVHRWLKQGFSVDDFIYVINIKHAEWSNTDMAKYLRPETLFGSKFESYLNTPVMANLSDKNKKTASAFSEFVNSENNTEINDIAVGDKDF